MFRSTPILQLHELGGQVISPSCTEVAYSATNASTRGASWYTTLAKLNCVTGNRQPGSERQDLLPGEMDQPILSVAGTVFSNPKADQIDMTVTCNLL